VGALIGGGLVSCSSIRGYIDDTGRAAIIVFTIGGALLCAIGVFIGSANPEEKDMIGFLAGGCLGAIVVAIIGAIGGAIIGAIVDDFNGVYGFFGGAILGAIVGAIGGGIGSVQSD
jgi:hypothetical protein